MNTIAKLALLSGLLAHTADGQSAGDTATVSDLRHDGNDVVALRSRIVAGFQGRTANDALVQIARQARVNLTFDAQLPQLRTLLYIPAHRRSAATALIEVAQASRVRIRVSARGNLLVDTLSLPARNIDRASVSEPRALPVVRVEADRRERADFNARANLGDVRMTAAHLNSAPVFVEPDVLRSVQALPGIEARSDYAAGFNTRGGESDQNLILMDGYPIYSPFHLGGVFSTFINSMVGDVTLMKGGLPVQYGGRLSGVLDVQSTAPTSRAITGAADVSLASASAMIGRAFGDDGAWSVGARRTYADKIVDVFKRDGFPYHFGDMQAHLESSIGAGVRLGVTAYEGLDQTIGHRGNQFTARWGNGVEGATARKVFVAQATIAGLPIDSLAVEQRVSRTRFNTRLAFPDEMLSAENRLSDSRIGGSATAFTERSGTTLGYELGWQRSRYRATAASASFGDIVPLDSLTQHARFISAYAQQAWRMQSFLLLEGGARVDVLDPHGAVMVSPRVSMKYFLRPDIALSIGGGAYAQWVHSLGREEQPAQPVQVWVVTDSTLPVSRLRDVVVGYEQWLARNRLVQLSAFHKRYSHLLLPNTENAADISGDEFFDSKGTSSGAEILLRQLDGGAVSGWIAYTFAVSSRADAAGTIITPTQDRRHNLNVVASGRVRGWTLGCRLALASGLPYTPVLGTYVRERYDPATGHWIVDHRTDGEQNVAAPFNSARLPAYRRLDVSASRGMQVRGAAVTPYLSFVNVTNASSPAAYHYTFDNQPHRTTFPNLPFVPTLGFNIVY
jgi:hypothetical protein